MFHAEGPHINWCANGRGEIVRATHFSSSSNVEWRSLSESLDDEICVNAPDQRDCVESDPRSNNGDYTLAAEDVPLTGNIQ